MLSKLTVFFIFIAGGIGAILRYGLSIYIDNGDGFPLATLTANLVGCFLLPIVFFIPKLNPTGKLILGTGIIGSFTTFSTFSVESIKLLQNNQFFLFLVYIGTTIVGGLLISILSYSYMGRRVANK
ncbi:CrcB protein [Salirhabdus euzebyi]|uniref:Fluoride-specific ion channel FluC n=1 Tax=Salirhabdus euzebyi TaxID=394506 RepID=A0A841Q543_9BACI|nr:fluoride efflux transporter CrcB [Salirhabdus euzebyi]MBB6453490.1 CrcB protein [Salirhabdus euzebyi]